jgi:hypothetical protein
MGLDMYLYKRNYVQKWEHHTPENTFDVSVKRGGVTYPNIKPERIVYVIEKVAQWRKFYPLNDWLFENCPNDSQEFSIDREKIIEVIELLKQQVENPEEEIIKGITSDEWFVEEAHRTIQLLEDILSEDDSDDFIYYAS